MIDDDKVYTHKEAADLCGYTSGSFYTLPRDERPQGFRLNGRRIYYRGRAIREWLDIQEAKHPVR